MISFQVEPRASNVWFDNDNLWLNFYDGRKLSIPLTYFPRLSNASDSQRKVYTISGGGTGIHWDEINEDINVVNLLFGNKDISNYNHIT
ncbi:hypothetical protein MHK_009513 [Candidatus Magnetomorum sp. HK-1]|nr:hypothetical protein MHK_009513 [Candidatus Magnetomorum sp. HK-1]